MWAHSGWCRCCSVSKNRYFAPARSAAARETSKAKGLTISSCCIPPKLLIANSLSTAWPVNPLPSFALVRGVALWKIPACHLVFGFLFCDAVALLDFAHQTLAFSVDHIQIVVGKLSPLLADRSLHLSPFTFCLFPVHSLPPIQSGAPLRCGNGRLQSVCISLRPYAKHEGLGVR